MNAYQTILAVHIAAGTVALCSYWTAGLMAKGTPRHRRIGQAYLLAMLGVIASGVPLAVQALVDGRPVFAAFLGFLLLLVSQACWSAWRAIRDRRAPQRYFGPVHAVLTGACVLAGAGIIATGLSVGSTLLTVFGTVGGLVGLGSLAARRRVARGDRMWWLCEHYDAMVGNGVATHISFFSFGLHRLLPGVDPGVLQQLAWFTPLAVALVATAWLHRRYGRTGPRPGARAPAALPPRRAAGA